MARPKLQEHERRQLETAYVSPSVSEIITQFQAQRGYRSRSAAIEALIIIGSKAAGKDK